MPSIRIRGDYRFRAFINLIVFKIAYTKTGTVDQVFDMPVGGTFTKTLRVPGPFDINVGIINNEFLNRPHARAAVHLDGVEEATVFSWQEPIEVSKTIPVNANDLRNGNHFHGSIEFKL